MADHFLIKTKGGPEDGATRVIPRDMYGWPLPAMLPLPGGVYLKISESQLAEESDSNPHVARGAEYQWMPGAKVGITITCQVCGKEQPPLEIFHHQLVAWRDGFKIQDALPNLSPGERQLLMSATCEPCFDRMFGEAS